MQRCPNLTDVILGQDFDANISLVTSTLAGNGCVSLPNDVMNNMFAQLKDNTGLTSKTITIGTTNLNKLSSTEKAVATGKNWILA